MKIVLWILLGLLILVGIFFALEKYFQSQFDKSSVGQKGASYPASFSSALLATCDDKKLCQCELKYLEDNYSYNEYLSKIKVSNQILKDANNFCASQ